MYREAAPQRDPAGIDPRLVPAILRWRLRRMLRRLPTRQRQAIRFVPALLHANFQQGEIAGEAPGVEGIRRPRGWAVLARAFGISPPVSAPRGRRLIRAIYAVPRERRIEISIVPAGALTRLEEERLVHHLIAAEGILHRGGVSVRLRLLDLAAADDATRNRLLAFSALVAGTADEDLLASARLGPAEAAALVADATTPLSALAAFFLAGGLEETPAEAAQALHEAGIPAAALADPSLFVAALAHRAAGDPRILEAVALASSDPRSRRMAQRLLVGERDDRAIRQAPTREWVLDLGRDLTFAAFAAVRALPRDAAAPARARLREEVLAPAIPLALLPALQALPAAPGKRGRPAGPEPGREQQFVRRLALSARLGLDLGDELSPFWRRAAALLSARVARRHLLLAAEMTDEPGPPMDPINRGPERRVALRDPVVVQLRPGARPTARRVKAADAVARLVLEAVRGSEVEVIGASGADQPAVSRLQRLAHLCRTTGGGEIPLAVQVGGAVLLPTGGKLRRFDVRRFAARPRRYLPDPDAPDLAPPAAVRGPSRRTGASIDCVVFRRDEESACLIYTDAEGRHLREELPLAFLEDHLQEAQALLRRAETPTLLAVRVAGDLDAAMLRARTATGTGIEIDVAGDLFRGLRIQLHDEWFGAGCELGFRAAAASAMSRWSEIRGGRIAIRSMEIEVGGEPASAMDLLYARSVVRRRLLAWIGHATKAP